VRWLFGLNSPFLFGMKGSSGIWQFLLNINCGRPHLAHLAQERTEYAKNHLTLLFLEAGSLDWGQREVHWVRSTLAGNELRRDF
jgi:hypothetical protein